LAEGGWLLTAAADPILAEHAPFEVIVTNAGLVYRRPRASVAPNAPPMIETPGVFEINAARLEIGNNEPPRPDPLAKVREAFNRKDYVTAAALARQWTDNPEAWTLCIRALANLGSPEATNLAQQAIQKHPLYPDLYYLLAHLRLLEGDQGQAILLLRKALYLAPSLLMAHFALASLLQRSGDRTGAERHFRNATELAAARPPNEIVPMSDGELTAALAAAARKSLQEIGKGNESATR
jgi:chemotaxis protein methyltransferase CheR